MRDSEIRESIHKKILVRHHANINTLVIDELGIKHGDCRADIAVINGSLSGFEIKSESDSLLRLRNQVIAYDSVFDYSTIIVAENHHPSVMEYVSDWWGIVICVKGVRGAINFATVRKPMVNVQVDPYSVAQLLWRNEVLEILRNKGVPNKDLRRPRSELYESIILLLDKRDLRNSVRNCLMKRKNWKRQSPPSRYDD